VDYMRIRAYPFSHEIHDFVASHERVYVVEQNRDAQLASLLKLDLPAEQVVKLRSILHFNGLPLDAQTVVEEFATKEGFSGISPTHVQDVEVHEGAVAS
jgi:2-oxoglutarate ferredoxin oxidoreductase subunit alpha